MLSGRTSRSGWPCSANVTRSAAEICNWCICAFSAETSCCTVSAAVSLWWLIWSGTHSFANRASILVFKEGWAVAKMTSRATSFSCDTKFTQFSRSTGSAIRNLFFACTWSKRTRRTFNPNVRSLWTIESSRTSASGFLSSSIWLTRRRGEMANVAWSCETCRASFFATLSSRSRTVLASWTVSKSSAWSWLWSWLSWHHRWIGCVLRAIIPCRTNNSNSCRYRRAIVYGILRWTWSAIHSIGTFEVLSRVAVIWCWV